VQACVVLRPGMPADAEAIATFCRERVARYKCRRRAVFLDALPRNPSGKVLEKQQRERSQPVD
jgi:acyl-CoA synthetase (AMP-forming)/AMP-acid ligase II